MYQGDISGTPGKPLQLLKETKIDSLGNAVLLCALHEVSTEQYSRQATMVVGGLSLCTQCGNYVAHEMARGYTMTEILSRVK